MTNYSTALELAARLQQEGRLAEAECVCRQAIAECPGHAVAWNQLAVLAYQLGQIELAVKNFSQALAIDPQYAEAHNNLGNVLRQHDNTDGAIACYENAIRIVPEFGEAHYNLGVAKHRQSRFHEAVEHYLRAAEIDPHCPHIYVNLGSALVSLGRRKESIDCYRRLVQLSPQNADAHVALGTALLEAAKEHAVQSFPGALMFSPQLASDEHVHTVNESELLVEAIDCFRRAMALNPASPAALNNLGMALQIQGHIEQAVNYYRRAIELEPMNAEVHNNLGTALKDLRQVDESVASYRRALELKPNYAEALNNLGTALKNQWKLDEAVACYSRAVELNPSRAEFHVGLGLALQEQRRLPDALLCYERAVALQPDYAEAHFAQATLALLLGDFTTGWRKYEWRWRRTGASQRSLPRDLWNGGELSGKTILLHAEQGLGDTIQFVRFIPWIKRRRPAKILLECQEALLPLLTKLPADQLLHRGAPLPDFDMHAPLLSLPYLLRLDLENVPEETPYLSVAPTQVQRAQNVLQSLGGFTVGIAWQGNASFSGDLRRSIPLRHFTTIAQVPGVTLISLQKGPGVEQLLSRAPLFPVVQFQGEWSEAIRTFEQTAAVILALDLVITSDTSIAHLAGALGVPVWVALSYMPDWRWMLDRDDSPWYPTMRLFRQPTPGDWPGTFRQMAKVLCEKTRE